MKGVFQYAKLNTAHPQRNLPERAGAKLGPPQDEPTRHLQLRRIRPQDADRWVHHQGGLCRAEKVSLPASPFCPLQPHPFAPRSRCVRLAFAFRPPLVFSKRGCEQFWRGVKKGVVEPRLGRGRFAFGVNAVRRHPELGCGGISGTPSGGFA